MALEEERERLLQLAALASPGEWSTKPEYRGWIFADHSYIATTHRGRDSLIVPNADYIAYASPERIVRLLTRQWRHWDVVDKPV